MSPTRFLARQENLLNLIREAEALQDPERERLDAARDEEGHDDLVEAERERKERARENRGALAGSAAVRCSRFFRRPTAASTGGRRRRHIA